jgi:Signal transduction histidine kinase
MASCLEEVDRLNSLVEDLLLMARLEGNVLSALPKPVNLAEVLEDVAPALTELAARAGNLCTVAATPPLWIEGYDSLLFRLVFNLAENAIKYTPSGGKIAVTLEQRTTRRFCRSRTTARESRPTRKSIFSIGFIKAIRQRRQRYRAWLGAGPCDR